MKRRAIAVILVGMLCLTGIAYAGVSANYDLSWNVIGGGGGPMDSASYAMRSTVGQIIGLPSSDNYQLGAGYWNGISAVPTPTPNITITSPLNSIYASTCVRLDFTVEPEGTVLDWIGYSLDSGANVTIAGNTTVFDTLGVTPPCDHNIVVYANDTDGNMAASNTGYFTMHPGDIKDDGKVDGFDLQRLAWAFLSKPGDPNWNERADLKCDNKIDGFDLQRLAWNFLNDYTVIC